MFMPPVRIIRLARRTVVVETVLFANTVYGYEARISVTDVNH